MRRMIAYLVMAIALLSFSIALAGGRPLSTTLSGAAEVNAAGVPNQGDPDGTGTADLTLNQGQGEICYELHVSGITLPATAAHIHLGAAGVSGGVVVPLSPPNASGDSSGCVVGVDKELIKAIRQNPSAYYVNVHNMDYPAGAIRGQLSK